MCLIFLSYKQNENYPFILLANRDEFYERPTQPAEFWEGTDVLAGKDLEAGGTWLGVNKSGRMALLTNYRDLANLKPQAPSRGKLVADYLQNSFDPDKYLLALDRSAEFYNGYNIILGTFDDPWYYSNYQGRITRLGSGLYGLSNALLDTPWPKVQHGKSYLSNKLAEKEIDKEALFDLMLNNTEAPDPQLPDTGVGLEKERALSPLFIEMENYGTRCTTLILVDQYGKVTFEERTKVPEEKIKSYEFSISD